MKRLLILVTCLTICLLTNLNLRVPVTVEAQAICATALAPTFTYGVDKNIPLSGGGVLKDGDLFYLGDANGVKFTTKSAVELFQAGTAADFVTFPGYPNTIATFFRHSTPNTAASMVSCLDSFWDISFVLYGRGAAAGDVTEIFLQQPDGSERIKVAEFKTQPDNQGTMVTYLLPGADLSAVGHTPTTVGQIIPFEIAGGSGGTRTQLITIALPMDGSISDCNQLEFKVTRAGGVGATQIVLVNLVVTRKATTTATGKGLLTGNTGSYPTTLKCDLVCPACDVLVCDKTICFYDAPTWLNRLLGNFSRYQNYYVSLPYFNNGQAFPISANMQYQIAQAIGYGAANPNDPRAKLISAYVAAQLSFQDQTTFYWAEMSKQKLGCHLRMPMAMPGMPAPPPALPITINGVVLDANSTFSDLFAATAWTINRGMPMDYAALNNLYAQLNNCKKD